MRLNIVARFDATIHNQIIYISWMASSRAAFNPFIPQALGREKITFQKDLLSIYTFSTVLPSR